MKKLFTLIMLLLVTGCTCSYELSIQDSSIYETLKINGVTTEIPVDVVDSFTTVASFTAGL